MSSQERLSIVVPVLNEEGTLRKLSDEIGIALATAGIKSYEIIFVDDGSSDNSWPLIKSLSEADPSVIGYRLRRNFGKATALALGAERATGSVLVTLDADLQDDPSEIPRFLSKLDEGFDLVSGWKQNRMDGFSKILASRVFNFTVRNVSGVKLQDINCGFKAARREVYMHIPLHGELHRFIPVLATEAGYRVAEIPITHRARVSGHSKYGAERFARGFLDLLTILAITRFGYRPGHLFGGLGLFAGVLGLGVILYLMFEWLIYGPIANRVLLPIGFLLIFSSIQFIVFGMLAEVMLLNVRPSSFNSLLGETTKQSFGGGKFTR
jgi:dolichol-phosphate mannosyltransferase